MLLDLYQGLMEVGFPLPTYHYVGFGSIFFVDFRILHKLLRIQKMTSIEGFEGLWERCAYNLPFSNVTLFKGLSSDFLPGMGADELYLAWFDYDFPVSRVVADDIVGLCSALRPWSLVFFTVDLEPAEEMEDDLPETYFEYFSSEVPDFAMGDFTVDDFKPPVRERTIISLIERCIKRGLRGRPDISFEYLIRLTYADGHRMLTVGGMIADVTARKYLSGEALADLWFLSREKSGYALEIPKLVFTPKEIAVLEQQFPGGSEAPRDIGIDRSDIEALQRFYRYWPSYAEALV